MKKSVLLILLVAGLFSIACTSSKNGDKKAQTKLDKQAAKEARLAAQEAEKIEKTKDMTKVIFNTSMGDITIALYNETPLHRDNFIKLVKEEYYNGILFHRIIQGFMIQTGDPNSKTAKPGQMLGNGGPGYTIPAEFVPSLYHKRGALAAARMGDQVNPKKESSGSQFYIVDGTVFPYNELMAMRSGNGQPLTQEQIDIYSREGGAPFLDGAYTVFGEVISGMDVVDKIAAQQKDPRDRPVNDISIISAKVMD